MLSALLLASALTITPVGSWNVQPPMPLTIPSITIYLQHRDLVDLPLPIRYGVEQWRPLVERYFAPGKVNKAMCVLGRESRGDPNAKNRHSSAAGIFQFLRGTWDWVARFTGSPTYTQRGPYDPVWSTINAAWLQKQLGWSQWTTAKDC